MNEDILSLTDYEHSKTVLPQLGRDGLPLIHVWACKTKTSGVKLSMKPKKPIQ